MPNINDSLKAEFKNTDWIIYVSINRPVYEILNYLPKENNCWAWDKHDRFAICSSPLSDKDVASSELKEFNFSFMDFEDNHLKLDIHKLFDDRSFDLKEHLKNIPEISERDIYSYFTGWRTMKDIDNSANKVIADIELYLKENI